MLYEVKSLPAELAEQVDVLQRCAELTAEAMPRLQSMKDLEEYWIEINRLENTGDKSYRRILAKLFSGQYEALEVLKLKDIVESLEPRSTPSRRSPTSSSRSTPRSPERWSSRSSSRWSWLP